MTKRISERSRRLAAAGALTETASALVQLETACRGIVSLTDREARLQDFTGAERLFRRIRSAIRHVAKELNDGYVAVVGSAKQRSTDSAGTAL